MTKMLTYIKTCRYNNSMLLEVFILFQIVAIVALVSVFFAKSIMPSLLTIFTSAILMVGAWIIETGYTYLWNPAIRAYVIEPTIYNTPYLPYINMAIFGLGMVFFIGDIMTVAKGGTIASWTDNLDKKEEV